MLKLIVIDWDGTLADSVNKIVECKRFLANKYNLPVPTDATVKNVLGTKFENALAKCFPNASPDILNEIAKEFHVLMQQDKYQSMLFKDANAVLDILKKRGIKLAIATSKDRKEINRAIRYNNLAGIFDLVCCGKEYQEKPAPSMLNYLMKKLDVIPDECLMIGDTTTDIQFATNAGIKIVCVTFGAHSKVKLKSMNPFALIDEWKQLLEVIDKLCYSTAVYY